MQPVALRNKAALAVQIPDWARIVAYDGAVRSGKTIADLLMWPSYCQHGPEGLLLIGGRTERTIANNLILPMQEIFGPERIRYTRATGRVQIFGRDCIVVGFNDESSREKIQGLTLAGALVDEAAVIPESSFQMLISRLSIPGARLFLTCNPEGPEHWLLKKYLQRARLWIDKHGTQHERDSKDALQLFRVTFLLDDNTWLVDNNPEYIAELKKQYTGLWYRRMIESEWVAAEGAIYPMWDPARHVIPWDSLPPLQRFLGVSMDYGTTNATVALALGLTAEEHPRLVLFDEWRYDSRVTDVRLTDVELSARFRHWLAGLRSPRGDALEPEHIYLDPSAASFSEQLRKDGVRGLDRAANDVQRGISDVASLLALDQLIVTDRCAGWIKEAPAYSWDPKATEAGEDKPLKIADHDMDAGRYGVRSTKHLWRRALGTTTA